MRLIKTALPIPPRTNGFTLVELMVGILVGLVVVLAVTVVFLSIARSSAETLATARLNHDTRAAMTLITADLRRAGYWNRFAPDVPDRNRNPWGTDAGGAYDPQRFILVDESGQCIRYGYDRNSDGVVDATEHFGFRLASEQLQMWTGTSVADCGADAGWETLVGDSTIAVADLRFDEDDPEAINRLRVEIVAQIRDRRAGIIEKRLVETIFLRNAEFPQADDDDAEDD